MTFASIILPACNAQDLLPETLAALLAQSWPDYEILVVDDGSSDATARIARSHAADLRIRVLRQANRGLAGARNSGIAAARGAYVGFCDAGDLWHPEKLARHIAHLEANPRIGVSFAGATLIAPAARLTGGARRPRLTGLTAATMLRHPPISAGSGPVLRRAVLDEIAHRPRQDPDRTWYFDETFRQPEDTEGWLRIALTTGWQFEGLPGRLTRVRTPAGAPTNAPAGDAAGEADRQLAAWDRMVAKLTPLNPAFFAAHAPAARAYRMRTLCRDAIRRADPPAARNWARRWLATSRRPLIEAPASSALTLAGAAALSLCGGRCAGAAMQRLTGLRRHISGRAEAL
ncbi:glycosyltransferase family 2 protein [Pseudooceanicola aestuarii]|uniref:glycosyltransferase family 2 protein n=1 Tax=Pseudooceanicola aestuarii TaxID=2697319 RepID=UPI0013D7DFA9|nr:glycosyltransferase family 2 protein [Pseudooceanicola aestuarii]